MENKERANERDVIERIGIEELSHDGQIDRNCERTIVTLKKLKINFESMSERDLTLNLCPLLLFNFPNSSFDSSDSLAVHYSSYD